MIATEEIARCVGEEYGEQVRQGVLARLEGRNATSYSEAIGALDVVLATNSRAYDPCLKKTLSLSRSSDVVVAPRV
jgi:hypothetical protein